VLREVFPASIWLQPDGSGRFMYAYFEDGCRTALFDQEFSLDSFPIVTGSACVVAGAGFGLALQGSDASADNSLRSAAEALKGTLVSDWKRLEIRHFCFAACGSSIRQEVFAGVSFNKPVHFLQLT
jgi:hypothetical protein